MAPLKKNPAPYLLAVSLLTILFYIPLFSNSFTTWDDYQTIARNPAFNPPTFDGVMSNWTKPHMHLYVPVTYMVWGLVATIAYSTTPDSQGIFLSTTAFHTTNLLLHTGSAVLVFMLLKRLTTRDAIRPNRSTASMPSAYPAAIGALFFALHPLQVETVCWLSGTKDLLMTFLSLLALQQYLRASALPTRQRWMTYGVATLCFVLAMLAKPTAVVLPAMGLVLDMFMNGRSIRQALRPAIVWFALAIPCLIWTHAVQPASLNNAGPLHLRPLVAADALAFYLGKLFCPLNLCIDYGRTPSAVLAGHSIYWIWIVPVSVAGLAFALRKRLPWLGVAAIVFVIPLLPVLGLVPFDFQAYSTVADHYVYLPMVGISIAVTSVLLARSQLWRILAGVVVCLLGIQSAVQCGVWYSTNTLFEQVLEVNPKSRSANNSLAADALARNEVDKAIELASRAVELAPTNLQGHVTLGAAWARKGQLAKAATEYRQALQIAPDNPEAMTNLAGLLAAQGDLSQALPLARRVVALSPDNAMAHMNLGAMLCDLNNPAEGIPELQRACQLDPANEQIGMNLGIVLARAGQIDQAKEVVSRLLRYRPESRPALQLLNQLNQASKAR